MKNHVLFASTSTLLLGAAQAAMSQVTITPIGVTITNGSPNYNLNLNGVTDYRIFFDATLAPQVTSEVVNKGGYTNGCYVVGIPDPLQDVNSAGSPLLGGGTTIGPDLLATYSAFGRGYIYHDYGGRTVGGWTNSTSLNDGYMALELTSNGGATTNWGWVELQYDLAANMVTIVQSGYNATPDGSLITPEIAPVPEPATVALIGAGGALLALRLRSKKK